MCAMGRPSFARRRLILKTLITRADLELARREFFHQPRIVHGVGIEQSGFGIECRVRPVLGAPLPRPQFDLLSGAKRLRHRGLDGAPGFKINVARPIHLFKRWCRDQLAVGTIHHIQETAAAHVHDHFARLALVRDIGDHPFPVGIEVEHFVRHQLIVPGDFAGLGADRQHRRRVQVIARTRIGIPRRGVAGTTSTPDPVPDRTTR